MINGFTYIVFGTALGTIVYLIWKLAGRWSEKRGYVDISYWIWKVVLLSFWCPISFFVLLKIRKNGLYGFEFWKTAFIMDIASILFFIWVAGTVICIIRYGNQHRKIHKAIRQCEVKEQSPILQEQISEISKRVKLHRSVKPVISHMIEVPMAYGLFQPKVLLPAKEYSQQELEVILLHELVHHKHHDLFWKQLFQITRCIYWFHPAMQDILRQLDQWGETACDMTVSRYVKSVKDYFNIIITIAVERPECGVYMAGLCEGTKLLMLRMQRMNAYMKKRPLKKVVSAGLVMMVFGVSAVTVAASSIGYAKGYSYIADKTMPEAEGLGESIDYVVAKGESTRNHTLRTIKEIKQKRKIPKIGQVQSVDIKIKPGQRVITQGRYINKKKGKEIEISLLVDTDNEKDKTKVSIGIIDEKNRERFIQSTDANLWHGFEIKESGVYKAYIENDGSEEIEFSTTVNVNWTVNAKVLKRSKEFTKKAGEEIAINIRVSPAKKVQIGIIEGGKVKKSYQTTTGINRKIPITKKDTYAVFVQNMSGSQIKAKGSYQK